MSIQKAKTRKIIKRMISTYISSGSNLHWRHKFIINAKTNISGVEAQNLLNKLKIPIKFGKLNPVFNDDRGIVEMTVAELDTYMKDHAIEYFYLRRAVLIAKPKVASPKRIRLSLAGLDTYECKCAGKSRQKTTQVLRKSFSVSCECRATFRVNFPTGYYHTQDGELNLVDHGDKMVRITWSWRHNHDFDNPEFFMSLPLSKMAREALKEAVIKYGITWFYIQHMQIVERLKSKELRTWELMKVENRHIRYILSQIPQNQPFRRHVPIVEGFGLLARKIQSDGGLAEFTTKFKTLDERNDSSDFKLDDGRDIWSFCFMSNWQRELLRQNSWIIHLDSTHKTCFGLARDEATYLFTILVKDQKTGRGAPVAFMLSNSGRSRVIADFLRKVRAFTSFEPRQAVIDCDQAETAALRAVWGADFPIMYCRFHVEKAFKDHLKKHLKGLTKNLKIEMYADFVEVLLSRTETEAAQKMSWLLSKHQAHKTFIAYVKRQWFSKKNLIIEGCNAKYAPGQNTNNYIESYHAKMKHKNLLGKICDRRPDTLAFKLYVFIIPLYIVNEMRVEDNTKRRVHDQAEDSAKRKANELSDEDVEAKTFLADNGEITVLSFTDNTKEYSVRLELDGKLINTCTCPAYCNTGSMCKHMFLARRFKSLMSSGQNRLSQQPSLSGSANLVDDVGIDPTETTSSELNDLPVMDPIPEEEWERCLVAEARGLEPEDQSTFDAACDLSDFFLESSLELERGREVTALPDLLEMSTEEECVAPQAEERNWESYVTRQGPGNRPQEILQHCDRVQEATQRSERELQQTLAILDSGLEKSHSTSTTFFRNLKSVERQKRYLDLFNSHQKLILQEMSNPRAKQRY